LAAAASTHGAEHGQQPGRLVGGSTTSLGAMCLPSYHQMGVGRLLEACRKAGAAAVGRPDFASALCVDASMLAEAAVGREGVVEGKLRLCAGGLEGLRGVPCGGCGG
jgi:hypothetical protein